MNMNVQFFTILCMLSVLSPAQSERPLTLPESIFIGGTAGAAEVTFPGQLLSYLMNKKINKEPVVLRQSYRGGLTNAVGQFPITAATKAAQVKGSQALENWQQKTLSETQKIGVSFGAGMAGGVIDTASNAVQLYLQNQAHAGKSALQACKELGLKGSLRGLTPNTLMKEGPFAVGWQILGPKGKKLAHQFVDNELIATALGGIPAGIVTAVITQPGAVIRTTMQNDPFKTVYTTTRQTVQKIYEQQGVKGFFKGLPQRGGRVAIAIPLYVAYGSTLEKWIKK